VQPQFRVLTLNAFGIAWMVYLVRKISAAAALAAAAAAAAKKV